jgi:hypothetical protein
MVAFGNYMAGLLPRRRLLKLLYERERHALGPHISRIGHWMDFRVIPASSLSSNRAIQAIR